VGWAIHLAVYACSMRTRFRSVLMGTYATWMLLLAANILGWHGVRL
jgi:hypothetical protein